MPDTATEPVPEYLCVFHPWDLLGSSQMCCSRRPARARHGVYGGASVGGAYPGWYGWVGTGEGYYPPTTPPLPVPADWYCQGPTHSPAGSTVSPGTPGALLAPSAHLAPAPVPEANKGEIQGPRVLKLVYIQSVTEK